MRLRACIAIAASALAFAESAAAGTFSVSPVRIYMQQRERATAVTIVNEGTTEIAMQAELYEWRQKSDGTDELIPTSDLIMAPPQLKLSSKAQQVIRLANLRPVPPGRQLTYRLVVREIPEALPPAPGAQIQVALAFSLPVFITPPGAVARLNCTAARASKDTAAVTCENDGQAYGQPISFALTGQDGTMLVTREVNGGYVLPEVRRRFELKRDSAIPSGPARLAVTLDDGTVRSFDVVLAD
jgi:fimbrial chaperone protein